jgi:periplasmic protein TonB
MSESVLSKVFNRWSLPDAPSRLDLVFENRFKDYGAYQIRLLFRKSQTIATIAACSLALLFASTPRILDYLSKTEDKERKTIKIVTNLDDIESPMEEEEEKPKEPPKLKEPEPVAQQAYVAPRINPDAQEDAPINPPDIVSNTGFKNVEGITDPTLPDMSSGNNEGPIKGNNEGPVAKVDVKAAFPGGEKGFREYVAGEFQYPVRCQDEGINGSVVLRFVVDQSGRVSNITAIEETKSCPEFTQEAIRVLGRSPRWIPGQNKGRFVNSWREIPIRLSVE